MKSRYATTPWNTIYVSNAGVNNSDRSLGMIMKKLELMSSDIDQLKVKQP
jgi:hypothetical protein